MGRPFPCRVGRSLTLAKRTHQNLGSHCPQLHQSLPICHHPNLYELLISQSRPSLLEETPSKGGSSTYVVVVPVTGRDAALDFQQSQPCNYLSQIRVSSRAETEAFRSFIQCFSWEFQILELILFFCCSVQRH